MWLLTPLQFKQLLQDVESKNIQRRQIKFLHICNGWPSFYGEPRTPLRRAFQKQWAYIKTWPIRRYHNFLLEHDVIPSSTTQDLLEKPEEPSQTDGKGESTTRSSAREKSEAENKPEKQEQNQVEMSDYSDDEDEQLNASFGDLSFDKSFDSPIKRQIQSGKKAASTPMTPFAISMSPSSTPLHSMSSSTKKSRSYR